LLINELDTTTILQRFGAKLVVISDILKVFVQDSQIDQDEARWLVKEIAKFLRNLSSQIMVVISVHECPPQYQSLLLSLFENQIDIGATREPSRLHFKSVAIYIIDMRTAAAAAARSVSLLPLS
jgi:hypothetical protein